LAGIICQASDVVFVVCSRVVLVVLFKVAVAISFTVPSMLGSACEAMT
jgi:hypothetical protein